MCKFFKRTFAALMSVAVALWLVVGAAAEETELDGTPSCEQIAVERMISGFESFAERIDLSDLNIHPDSLSPLFYAATKNSPYLFYVDNHLSYTYRTGGCVVEVIPRYKYSEDEAREMVDFCRTEIKKLAAVAAKGNSDIEKVLLSHDLICRNFAYDTTLESNNLYSFSESRVGTCQGYTWCYMALLREIGLECEYVASDSIVHIWLMVKIDGEWYHSDVTWDDPPSAEGAEGRDGEVSRRHFLFSDKKADADGYLDRYSSAEASCISEKYDDFDFSALLTPCAADIDTDHNGKVELSDLVRLRLHAEQSEKEQSICPICSDLDKNFIIDAADLTLARRLILNDP